MIEKKIKALKDIVLNTYRESHSLIKDEVKIVKFRNQRRFENLLNLGNFIEADRSEEEIKNIPVIPSPIDNTVKEAEQELPFVEAIQGHNDLDEAGEPMEEETPEDLRRDEPLQVEEEIEEVVKEPVSEEILEDLSQADVPRTEEEIERAATEGVVGMGFEVQPVEEISVEEQTADLPELEETPEEPPEENLPEVEEIPIEEQDESKLELQPDEVVDDRSEE